MTISDANRLAAGGVVIGRNEGERLRRCLTSMVRDLTHVVYVDSGSEDESLTIAKGLGVDVVNLDTANGFTAARGRNAGFQRLIELAPDLEFVQFVDGDCEVVDGWLAAAAAFLRTHVDVAVVCGRRREREPDRNIYHRLADMEWDSPVGLVRSCGGDAMVRTAAFEQVGGYRDSQIAGEEPEMCVRLRQAGWRIWRLDEEMTLHDIRMSHFGQWWQRAVRAGHAYAEVAALHGSLTERERLRKLISIWSWTLVPVVAIALTPPTHGYSLVVAVGLLLLLFAKVVRHRTLRHRDPIDHAGLYAAACVIANLPAAIGSLKFLLRRIRRQGSRLIEYK